jgi:hypothetical protein
MYSPYRIQIIAEQAGHEDINTTVGYARYTDEEKNQILDKAYAKSHEERTADNVVALSGSQNPPQFSPNMKPMEFLQMQLLRGEVTKEEYVEKVKLLMGAKLVA